MFLSNQALNYLNEVTQSWANLQNKKFLGQIYLGPSPIYQAIRVETPIQLMKAIKFSTLKIQILERENVDCSGKTAKHYHLFELDGYSTGAIQVGDYRYVVYSEDERFDRWASHELAKEHQKLKVVSEKMRFSEASAVN